MPVALAFIPHPDDESYSFGGALALAARAGWECHVVCASSGERGKRHDGGTATQDAIGLTREAELGESCRVLGIHPPRFWRLPDGALREQPSGPGLAAEAISRVQPELVITLGPDGAYGHPDHIALHRWVTAAWQSAGAARPHLLYAAFPPGLFIPQYHKCIGMMGDPPAPQESAIGAAPWHYTVPTRQLRRTKLASIGAHRSQLPGGDPEALFPPGIVAALLDVEHFSDATGREQPAVTALLAGLS